MKIDGHRIVLVPTRDKIARWKAVPLVLRSKGARTQLLCFRHPVAGCQLVKGGIKKGEAMAEACRRELKEESGLKTRVLRELGWWESEYKRQAWGFCLMDTPPDLPETWKYHTKDDGGRIFRFFWQDLDAELDREWHPVFHRAMNHIRRLARKGELAAARPVKSGSRSGG